MNDLDERVRQRAHRLWVEEGCPEGRSDIHWQKARELVAIEDNHKATLKPAPDPERPGREPVEPLAAVENAGEFPTLTDQGEERAAPTGRVAAAKAKGPLKSEAPKPASARPKTAPKPKAEPSAKGKPGRPR
jgi:Protein of unknown function (DUF2934)